MDFWVTGIGEAMGLAAVALIGYLFGRRTRTRMMEAAASAAHPEIERAAQIAGRLERIAESLRQSLANHHAQVLQFKRNLRQARELPTDESWEVMCAEAETVLVPTMALASQLSQAYDELRKQSIALATFTAGRVDPLTGIATARAFEEQVAFHLRCQQSNNNSFSVAMLTADLPVVERQPRSEVERVMQNIAHLLQTSVRGHDFVSRYGSEEFAVLLPSTKASGANQFAVRIRQLVKDQLGLTLSIGLAESMPEEETKSLIGRADSALYSARAAGGDEQYSHTGAAIQPHVEFVDVADNTSVPTSKNSPVPARRTPAQVEESLDELAGVLVEAGA